MKQFKNLLLASSCMVLLAACGSASTAPTTTTTSSTTTSTTTSTTSTTSTTVYSSNCSSSEVTATLGLKEAAAGSVALPVAIKNTTSQSCTISGYPGLQMVAASGKIPTVVAQSSSVSVPSEPVTSITINPGASAYFILGFSDSTGYSGVSCPTSSSIEITLPGDTKALSVAVSVSPYGGTVQNLQCGLIHVTPMLSSLPAGYQI
ncbi:MAG: DUF4232 domain-containing protein [Acidimicrobiaceae bacterium]|nr:DUF4232 domain-containing protein [Acidimicrobiaceae bacterium]